MKKCRLIAAVSLAAVAGLRPEAASGQAAAPVRDFGGEVRAIFATKCAGCHGPDLAKPKGRFGYVLDLRRVAGNPEMVIPRRPTESELWVLVERDEMPPADSPHGALTQEQKEVIRGWIAAGAQDASPVASDSAPLVQSELALPSPGITISAERLLRWLGKFHLLLLHFPIALFFAAGVGEGWSVWRRNPLPSESVRFCLWLAALGAIPTAGLGWLFAASGNGASSPQLLTAHRWLGTSAAVCLLVTALCAERDGRSLTRSRHVWLLLICGCLITALTAHFGGLLSRGEDFLSY
jgi:uncharacterized membrane protein/mono/diheme cytochrome c family protein